MKYTVAVIVAFFVTLFVYTKLAGPIPFAITSVTTTKIDTFNVTGIGKATVTPDITVVNAGVTTSGDSVSQVQQNLNKNIAGVSDAIKKLGVDAKDIQTTNYTISPMYDFQQGQRIKGYQANTNLTIKIRAMEKTNSVIDAATANGANMIGGISFEVADETKAQNEARAKAVEEARKKAEDAARIAGFKLGRIINYSENFGNGMRPVPMYAKADAASGVGVPTQVEPGSNEVQVQVTLSYEIQ